MSGQATMNQYIDTKDSLNRWIASVCYLNMELRTFQLASLDDAIVECYRLAQIVGWKINDSDFW